MATWKLLIWKYDLLVYTIYCSWVYDNVSVPIFSIYDIINLTIRGTKLCSMGHFSMFRHKIYMHGFYVSDESGTHFGAYSLTYTQILGMNANIGYERKKN